MTDRATLLAQVLANPDDDEPRLVFADWLTEQGDPRGEFIAVQCAIAAGHGNPITLGIRERELLEAHEEEWTERARLLGKPTMHRGFVGCVKTTASRFAWDGPACLEHEPIEHLIVEGTDPDGLLEVAEAPILARLRRLELRLFFDSERAISAVGELLRAPHLALRELTLHLRFETRFESALPKFFAGFVQPALARLVVHLAGFQHEDPYEGGLFRSLAKARLPALRELSIEPFVEAELLSRAFPAAKLRRLVL